MEKELLPCSIVHLGGDARHRKIVPFSYASKQYLLSIPAPHLVRLEAANLHLFEHNFYQLFYGDSPLDQPICVSSSFHDDVGVFAISWQNQAGAVDIGVYTPSFSSSSPSNFLWSRSFQILGDGGHVLALFQHRLLCSASSTQLTVWNLKTQKKISTFDYNGIVQAGFSPNGRLLATLDSKFNVRVGFRNSTKKELSFLLLKGVPLGTSYFEWRPRRGEAQTLLCWNHQSFSIFQESDAHEEFRFVKLYELHQVRCLGWIHSKPAAVLVPLASFWDNEVENDEFASLTSVRENEDFDLEQFGGFSPLQMEKDRVHCTALEGGEFKLYCFEGLGQHPRMSAWCLLETSGACFVSDDMCRPFTCGGGGGVEGIRLFSERQVVPLFGIATNPIALPLHQAGTLRSLHMNDSRWVTQDDSHRILFWNLRNEPIKEVQIDHQTEWLVSVNTKDVVVLVSQSFLWFHGQEKPLALNLPCAIHSVHFQDDSETVVVLCTTVCLFYQVKQNQILETKERISLGHNASCLSDGWIGTQEGVVYSTVFADLEIVLPEKRAVKKIANDQNSVWVVCLLENGTCHVAQPTGEVQSLEGWGVVDCALCEMHGLGCYSLALLLPSSIRILFPKGGEWLVHFTLDVSGPLHTLVWRSGQELMAFDSSSGMAWELSDERMAKQAKESQVILADHHPDLLLELVRLGQMDRIKHILKHLYVCLVKEDAEQQRIVSVPPSPPLQQIVCEEHSSAHFWASSSSALSRRLELAQEEWLPALETLLPTKGISQLASRDHLKLINLLGLVRKLDTSSTFQVLDAPGKIFATLVECTRLNLFPQTKTSHVIFALQSQCPKLLVQHLLGQPHLGWKEDCAVLGLGYWLRDLTDGQMLVERLAKTCVVKFQKDAYASLLYYVVLDKPRVSSALFKMSGKEKVASLLCMDFSQPANQSIAIKNAFACVEKRMYLPAAAFFLLGKRYSEAFRIVAKNAGDIQLALLLSRLVLKTEDVGIISEMVLPLALVMRDPFLHFMGEVLISGKATLRLKLSPSLVEESWLKEFAREFELVGFVQSDPVLFVVFSRLYTAAVDVSSIVLHAVDCFHIRNGMPQLLDRFVPAPLKEVEFSLEHFTSRLPLENFLLAKQSNTHDKEPLRIDSFVALLLSSLAMKQYQVVYSLLKHVVVGKRFSDADLQLANNKNEEEETEGKDWTIAFCQCLLHILVLERLQFYLGQEHHEWQNDVDVKLNSLRAKVQALLSPYTLLDKLGGFLESLRPYSTGTKWVANQELWVFLKGSDCVHKTLIDFLFLRRCRLWSGVSQIQDSTVKSFVLYDTPGEQISSLALVGKHYVALSSTVHGLREVNIYSSLAFRNRTADGLRLLNPERDSYRDVFHRFALQEDVLTSPSWERYLLHRALYSSLHSLPSSLSNMTRESAPSQESFVRNVRDRICTSRLSAHPNLPNFTSIDPIKGEGMLWTVGMEGPLCALPMFSPHPLVQLRFSPDGHLLAGVDTTGTCVLYHSMDLLPFFHTEPHEPSTVSDLLFLSSTVFCTSTNEGRVQMIDSLLPPRNCIIGTWDHPKVSASRASTPVQIKRLEKEENSPVLFAASNLGSVFGIDVRKCYAEEYCMKASVSSKSVTSLALGKNNILLATGCMDGTVRFWDKHTLTPLWNPLEALHPVMSPVAPATSSLFPLSSSKPLSTNRGVTDLTFSQGSLFSCGTDGSVKLTFVHEAL